MSKLVVARRASEDDSCRHYCFIVNGLMQIIDKERLEGEHWIELEPIIRKRIMVMANITDPKEVQFGPLDVRPNLDTMAPFYELAD